ncbi:MAG: PAS domain S-box protein, partial [Syntrophorhabdales bacterium]
MSTNGATHKNRAAALFTSYGLTVLLVAAATAVRWGLGYAFGPMPPFLTFYPALMLAALIGGLGPGLVATGLGGLAANYFFIPPIGSLRITNFGDGVALGLFCFVGASISIITDRLRAARAGQARRESEERYRTLFDAMTEGFALHEIICDEKGKPCDYRFLEINPAFERLTGLKRDDLLGKTVRDVMPETEPYWIETYGKVALTGEPVHFENFASSLQRHYEVFAYSPAPGQFAALFTDVTVRKKAEIALQASEQRWATTLSRIGDAVIATDVAGRITFMNAVAEEMTGWTLEEASVRPMTEVFNIINEQTRGEVENPVAKVLRQGMVVGLANHTILVKKDGTEVPIDDSGAPIRDGDGHTTGVVLVFRDITGRREAEEALRKARDELEERVIERTEALRRQADLLELAYDAIILRDLDSRVIFWNARARDVYGFTEDEAIGQVSLTLLQTKFSMPFEEHMEVLTREGHWEGELTHMAKDGRRLVVLSRQALQRDESGRPVAIMEMNLDITEQKRIEAQLRQAQKMEALGTLSGGIAHDFNNILAAIIGFTELVHDVV